MTPSPQQSEIFTWITSGSGNLIVDAKAGSGKTTTAVWSMQHIPRGDSLLPPSVIFLAFNKLIATQLQARVPQGYSASTFHSLGLRALKDSGIVPRNVKVDGGKCKKLVWNAVDRDNPDTREIIRLVDLCKSVPWETPDLGQLREMVTHFGMPFDNLEKALRVVAAVIEASNRDLNTIDFGDMLYLPVIKNCPFDKYDWVFVDEAQDTNDIQLEILERLIKRSNDPVDCIHIPYHTEFCSKTRIVAVGDPHQAIYGFRGANSDSMQRIAERFQCKTLPLSVSYRCPKAVVREAQRYLR
jgi:DNA helicase-2/ATP-dependent DNA helicase PcrA